MNMMESFNNTIQYIETVLDDSIDEKEISCISGYSFPMFSRIFSILTSQTLAEYIRCRKLTRSAIDLRETDLKIIDIAIKYGYVSSDAFGFAFKNYHGFTPTEIRKGKPFKLFPCIQLVLSISGGRNMNIKIQRKPGFKVAGMIINNVACTDSSLYPKLWEDLFKKYTHEELSKLTEFGNGQSYGVCHHNGNVNPTNYMSGYINYMAGYEVTDIAKAKEMGLEILEISEEEYAVVTLKGSVPECIQQGWKYLMEVFFPQHGYAHSGKPDFEVYNEGDTNSPDYTMELWCPIVKA
ncbi:MAG: GyrI-like domain-containing protein [Neisseria sp.]|uniref:GyrI-like domain-containing protein n=1 Tax=Neisseria sp. TaxID=192066 RepID=UPI0026DB4323|nr:GyrI-like domain-containing protein [Neisseria sp.]MDO4641252.1 GyrI-like domain-containing protein [Neisseria sp.]